MYFNLLLNCSRAQILEVNYCFWKMTCLVGYKHQNILHESYNKGVASAIALIISTVTIHLQMIMQN